MDYSGSNVRVLQPPSNVKEWSPGYVCYRQGEIFVSNYGDSPAVMAVFRYTSKGQCLGCVTIEVTHPQGLALSQDGMELFVVRGGAMGGGGKGGKSSP